MNNSEDLIWDSITNSAKKRFDYSSFAKDFNKIDKNIAENIIFRIIVGFASGESKEIISANLFNQMLLTGFVWDKKEIDKFVEDKKELFKIEISAATLANNLLRDGNDAMHVLISINQLLV